MIIVTGASRGLGAAIADRLVEQGEEVLGLVRNANGASVNTIGCDIRSYTSVKHAAREVKRLKKPIKGAYKRRWCCFNEFDCYD